MKYWGLKAKKIQIQTCKKVMWMRGEKMFQEISNRAVLQSMGLQRAGHNLATEQQQKF